MTVAGSAAGTVEEGLLLRVLSTLLREDVVGLRTRSTVRDRPDGRWLHLAAGRGALALPVAEDGFQCEYTARLPLLRVEPGGGELTTGQQVLAALGALAAPEDRAGFGAFAAEYADALAALRLQAATREEVVARLGADPLRWRGPLAGLAFDTLAARAGHPLYPTGAARTGLSPDQLLGHAPEFAPRFALRWVAVPRAAVTVAGAEGAAGLGAFWPAPSGLGLPGLDATHLALPVHPLTAGGPLREAVGADGPAAGAVPAEQPFLQAAPTLSTRTVALTAHPGVHLKLPLAVSTLGLLNRRSVTPGSLVDGAAGQRLLTAVTAREPRFQGRVLHADETRYAHAGHDLLAVLVRRLPAGLDDCLVLPLAALTAPAPGGRLVIDHLADHWFGGEPLALLDAVLTLLLDWQTTLLGYGIALESHQQNISLLLDGPAGAPRVRLLFKDDDGPRINRGRLREALGADAPGPGDFADPRILTDRDGPVLDLFTTVTVHLCAGAFAFTLARHGRAPLDRLLGLVRDRLEEGARRLGDGPGTPGAALRARVLDAGRLPVKAMVTAGTLLTKNRSGASDINKYYTTGPNYLLRSR
ncbi:IucA/IucC family siderophore biosynthesis protein [Actinacidiphila sp. ITFR-21]|uniref:IucA/IucC family siderophore biosynthesis protein n=1 Tax=Actinacidiphila sp. ITFR-21 TaxID=3075199 RepID=UPI00288AF276|nr:IucA/IucC family siderophore biosynthesis protein [Streptomyces sp. ITFR-21]WNI18975.1 IucA/IucC family siderophore biosynthesis protein [Streptomyces sp. ITFR-21]